MIKIRNKQGEYFIEVETVHGNIIIKDAKVDIQIPIMDICGGYLCEGEEFYDLNLLRKSFYHLALLKENLRLLNEKIVETEGKCSI